MNDQTKSVPVVSVVFITYNHEPYIAQALESLLMQKTTFPVEILIGEDCSTDRSREICKSYAEKYPETVRLVISDENVGPGRNFLRTLHSAIGTYVAYCDGDDYWTDFDKLQKQVDFLESHPGCAICFHAIEVVDAAASSTVEIYRPFKDRAVLTLSELLLGNFIPNCSTMFRRGLFSKFPDWYLKLPQGDWSLSVLNAQYGDIGYLDQLMAVHRRHQGGGWTALGSARQQEYNLACLEAFEAHLDPCYCTALDAGKAACYWQLLAIYDAQGEIEKIKPMLGKALFTLRNHREARIAALVALLLKCHIPPLYRLARTIRKALSSFAPPTVSR